jgi:transposase-like protein
MQFDNTSIDPFVTVCPSCRREGIARPPSDGWSRHYLCAACGATWVIFTGLVMLRQPDSAGSSAGVTTQQQAP